jgi:hypothetical protein
MMTNADPRLSAIAAIFALGCSAGGTSHPGGSGSGDHGTGGSGSSPGGNGGGATIFLEDAGSNLLGAHIEENHVTVQLITLSCANPCADVEAIPTGGFAPYTFTWDDGSTEATRHVCPTATSDYRVTVKDSGSASGEFQRDPETVDTTFTARVPACSDGGESVTEGGTSICTGAPAPAIGRYVGNLTCPASTSSGGAAGATGTVILDLAADGTGSVFFRWSLVVIGAQGTVRPAGCSDGAPFATWDGMWGVPGPSDPNNPNNPPGLIPTGPITGDMTISLATGGTNRVAGKFDWDAPPFMNQAASICHGTFTADRVP